MIDIEQAVYNRVHDAVQTAFPDCIITDTPPEMTSKFPVLTIRETNNRTEWHTQDDAPTEHHAIVVYEVNVYSNRQTGRKRECKDILQVADTVMLDMMFNRILMHELPTVDRTIARVYARYEAVVGEPDMIDGDTVYQMYRR